MLTLLIGLAAIQATVPVAAPAPRMLKDIPGVTIKYYDVAGKDAKAIQKSLATVRPKGSDGKPVAASFNWSVKTDIVKRTEGATCKIDSTKVHFTGTAELPRLVGPSALDKNALQSWNDYVSGLDQATAVGLGYLADRMPQLERAVTGQSCDAASGALNAALEKLKAEQQQFLEAEIAKRAAGQAAAARAKKAADWQNRPRH